MSDRNETDVRREVKSWLEENWNADQPLIDWRTTLAESGWGMPTWPEAYFGKGYSVALGNVVHKEIAAAGAVGVAQAGVRMLAAATLLEHGTDAHKARFLKGILTGEDNWCQLFSEPGSGSDLAGLTTRADRDGDNWVINGQKVWTTSAHHAQYGMLLARTNWDVPKHQGISYFILDIEQPGVEVRPLRQMNGHASFNEVFFTDAHVSHQAMLGAEGGGWKIALTTLAHERRGADGVRSFARAEAGQGQVFEELREEVAHVMEPYKWYPQRAGRVDLIIDRAKQTGRNTDPAVRQEIAELLIMARASEWTARRARQAQVLGRPQGPEGSLGKLAASNVARKAAHVHTLLSGADAMLTGSHGAMDGLISEILISVPAISIAGGTDEIQRNIISERVLGMPKEPRTDVDRPFRDVPRNVSKR